MLPKLKHKHTGKYIPEWKRSEVKEMLDLITAATIKAVLAGDPIYLAELEARTKVYFELLARECGVEVSDGGKVQYLPAPDGEILEVEITDADAEAIVDAVRARHNPSLN